MFIGSTSHHYSLRQHTHIVIKARFRTNLGKMGRKYFWVMRERCEQYITIYIYIYIGLGSSYT